MAKRYPRLLALWILACGVLLGGCGEAPDSPLKLSSSPWPGVRAAVPGM